MTQQSVPPKRIFPSSKVDARAANDRIWLGIAQVYEAFVVGTAADLWGDIPYRDAVGSVAKPTLDPQMQVYGDIQLLLDSAIINLGSGTGAGPLGAEPRLLVKTASYILPLRLSVAPVMVKVSETALPFEVIGVVQL